MSIHWMGYLIAILAVVVGVAVWHMINGIKGASA